MRSLSTKNLSIILLMFVLIACSDEKSEQKLEQASQIEIEPVQTEQQSAISAAAPTPEPISLPAAYRVVETFDVGENVYVRSMAVDKNTNTLWVGTSVGVLHVDLSTRNMLKSFTRNDGLANEYVFGIFVDSQGGKWFGTNGGGISYLNADQWKTYFPMHGLADYWVYSFAEQTNGKLWIGTWAGLNEFDQETGAFKTYLKELVNEWVYGLDVDSQDQVWIGTEGGINMFDGENWHTWTHEDGLGAPNVQNLPLSDNTGLGTRSRHDLNVMEQGTMTYNPNYVFTLLVADDDAVWAGTWGGGVSHYDGKKWTNYTTEQGLAGNIVYSIAQDSRGHFWIGTNGGLSHFDGEEWRNFSKSDGLLDNNVYAISATKDSDIWIGSKSGVTFLSQQ